MKPGDSLMKHYLQFKDFRAEEYAYLFERAALIKKRFKNYEKYQPLVDRTLAMIFEKASTRTRVSFEAGMYQMGGSVVHLTTGVTRAVCRHRSRPWPPEAPAGLRLQGLAQCEPFFMGASIAAGGGRVRNQTGLDHLQVVVAGKVHHEVPGHRLDLPDGLVDHHAFKGKAASSATRVAK